MRVSIISMDIQPLASRCILFTFFELNGCPTSVFTIVCEDAFFICDTFLGPVAMEAVKDHLLSRFGEKKYVVFNSHHHWDHIWGNCAFQHSPVIAHRVCREMIMKCFEAEFQKYGTLAMGRVTLSLPTTTFSKSFSFPDEGVEFFHTPGHTADSSSCLDIKDSVLFLGDNIEAPIPYLESPDVDQYRKTLKKMLEIGARTLVAGHGGVVQESLIYDNISYLDDVIANNTEKYEKGDYKDIHTMNVKNIKGN